MSRVFAYCRVSTTGQTTENQVREIQASGFAVETNRVIEEIISGSSSIEIRHGFARLVDRLETGDVLVVTKLDRLGRNAIDVMQTVQRLATKGIRVHCLALGGTDLTSAAGRMIMTVISAMAQFERDLLIERTNAGLARAKASGKRLGRPLSLDADALETVRQMMWSGTETITSISRKLGVSRQTIGRVRLSSRSTSTSASINTSRVIDTL